MTFDGCILVQSKTLTIFDGNVFNLLNNIQNLSSLTNSVSTCSTIQHVNFVTPISCGLLSPAICFPNTLNWFVGENTSRGIARGLQLFARWTRERVPPHQVSLVTSCKRALSPRNTRHKAPSQVSYVAINSLPEASPVSCYARTNFDPFKPKPTLHYRRYCGGGQ